MNKSTLYTRKGDHGLTQLEDGTQHPKDHAVIEAYGTLDELSCAIGIIVANSKTPAAIQALLMNIQKTLLLLGQCLTDPTTCMLNETHITTLEEDIDTFDSKLSKITSFILPNNSTLSAHCHLARTICRRAERRIVTLHQMQSINQVVLKYINRLSDLLFVIARTL